MSDTSRNNVIQPARDKRLEAYLRCLKLPDNGCRHWSKIANALIETFCSSDGHPAMPSYMEAISAGHDFFHSTSNKVLISHQLWNNLEILLQVMVDCVAEISDMDPSVVLQGDGRPESLASTSMLVVDAYRLRYGFVQRLAKRVFAKIERSIIGQEDGWYGSAIHNATDLAAGRLPRLVPLDELFPRVWWAILPDEAD